MREMRKIKKKLSQDEAFKLIEEAKEITISMYDRENDEPYAVIVNPIYFNKNIYIHCARDGHKIDILKNNNKVCITALIRSSIVEEKYTSAFESVVISSHASFVENKDEKYEILIKLCEIYSPSMNIELIKNGIKSKLDTTTIIKFPIESISAKGNLRGNLNIWN